MASPITSTDESDILIVGGGLAGLALAVYLRRQDRELLLVEQASDWRDGGYGIGLWSDGIAVLDELGRLDTARDHGADTDVFEIRASHGDLLTRTTLPPEQTLLLAIHRADLHAALRADVPTDWVQMGTSPARIDERPDEVVVTFDDGTTRTFDLVVGRTACTRLSESSVSPTGRITSGSRGIAAVREVQLYWLLTRSVTDDYDDV